MLMDFGEETNKCILSTGCKNTDHVVLSAGIFIGLFLLTLPLVDSSSIMLFFSPSLVHIMMSFVSFSDPQEIETGYNPSVGIR